jgi:hypothetical protein
VYLGSTGRNNSKSSSGSSGGWGCVYYVYYETIKREYYRLIYECRCDERLKDKTERSTLLGYNVLSGGQGHLKIKTRLTDEKFASVMGECVFVKL